MAPSNSSGRAFATPAGLGSAHRVAAHELRVGSHLRHQPTLGRSHVGHAHPYGAASSACPASGSSSPTGPQTKARSAPSSAPSMVGSNRASRPARGRPHRPSRPGRRPPPVAAGAGGQRQRAPDQAESDHRHPHGRCGAPRSSAARISSATRKARSSDWRAFSRGSQQRRVVAVEVLLEHLLRAAQALRDVLPGELQVHAAGPGALAQAGREEALDLAQDVLEAARLVAGLGAEHVGVHRVAHPDDRVLALAGGAQQRRQRLLHPARAHARDQRQPPRDAPRVQRLAQRGHVGGGRGRPSFTPIGLWTPAKNATWAPSAARVRSPIQSMCAEQSYQSPVRESRRVSPCS